MAYGADQELFADFVDKGFLPKTAPKAARTNTCSGDLCVPTPDRAATIERTQARRLAAR